MPTTAITVQPDTSPYPVSGEQIGGIGFFVASAIGAVLYLRRRLPRDKLEALKDRTEGHLLSQIIGERDKAIADAREAWSKYNAQERDMGRMIAENEALKREMSDARESLKEIRSAFQSGGTRTDKTLAALTDLENRVSGRAPLS